MNEALEDYMREFCVIGYRLVDGSHIIAIEDHYDPDQKAFYVSGAVQVNTNSEGRIFFSPWLINDNDELVRLLDSNIIASSPPIEDVAIQYHRYLLMSNLNGVLSPAEIKVVLAQLFNNDIDFGQKVSCKISNNGDLIYKIYLRNTQIFRCLLLYFFFLHH